MADPLFKVSNSFHCGAYQACVSAGLEDVPEAASTQRDVFVYRAHLALGSTNVRRGPRAGGRHSRRAWTGAPRPRARSRHLLAAAGALLDRRLRPLRAAGREAVRHVHGRAGGEPGAHGP